MQKLPLLLLGLVFAAGCTAQLPSLSSDLTPVVQSLPEAKTFLNEYPEASIKSALYSPAAVKNVVQQFVQDCPALGEEGKSYYKVTIVDENTKQQLILWLKAEDNSFVCAMRTSVGVTTTLAKKADGSTCTTHSECASSLCLNNICSTPGGSATTASTTTLSTTTTTTSTTTVPTTLQTTTTANTTTTTTTAGETTTTAAGTTTTTAATTTTTTSPKPDLIISNLVKFSNSTHYSFQISVKNNGTVASTLTGLQHYVYYYNTATGTNVSKANLVQGVDPISPGSLIVSTRYFNYADSSNANGQYYFVVTIDPGNSVAESNENNNLQSTGFTK